MTKALKNRFFSKTPNWTSFVQTALLAVAGYSELVAMYPDLLNLIPGENHHKIAGYSALATVVLQFINKKKANENNESIKEAH